VGGLGDIDREGRDSFPLAGLAAWLPVWLVQLVIVLSVAPGGGIAAWLSRWCHPQFYRIKVASRLKPCYSLDVDPVSRPVCPRVIRWR
jgi:hypothetical protein